MKVLITVKTYPTLSRRHTELVCTAGILEDGSWIRIYPAPFRFLNFDQQYRKYQWVELDLEPNPKDRRPETYRPRNIDAIRLGDFVDTARDWAERRRLLLNAEKSIVYTKLEDIIRGANNNAFSLAVFKPAKILKLIAEDTQTDWDLDKREIAEANLNQGSLFEETDRPDFRIMPKLPVKFSYQFQDASGRKSTLMIEDWEIGQLYWNCLKDGDKNTAISKVRQKYFDEFVRKRDVYLFLGTTLRWHGHAPNPYVIVGVFYPPFEIQPSLL